MEIPDNPKLTQELIDMVSGRQEANLCFMLDAYRALTTDERKQVREAIKKHRHKGKE